MIGCVLAAALGSWMFYAAWPSVAPASRMFLVVPFLPLSAVAILVAAFHWARRLRPSIHEGVVALLVVELIIWGCVGLVAEMFFAEIVFLFWATIGLFVAPWWLLGVGVGRPRQTGTRLA